MISNLKRKILDLNIFETEATWFDDQHRHSQIIATRLYFLLFIVCFTVIVTYTSLSTHTQLTKIDQPSPVIFDELRTNPTLDCPCQNITIPYSSFVLIFPHYHQLCSSDFVLNNKWINLLYFRWASFNYTYDDYRLFVVPQFKWLVSLCTFANQTLNDALAFFLSNTLFTSEVQSRETIETQVNAILNQFRSSTSRSFMRTFDLIRSITQGNGIMSSTWSNWYFPVLEANYSYTPLWTEPRSYGTTNCSCGTNPTCSTPAIIGEWLVPGFRVGCSPLEALLQSTLECLYNMTCIERLQSIYQITNITMQPLNPTLSNSNATVQSLIDGLMVDWWKTNITYDGYYFACGPLSCTYSRYEQFSVVYIMNIIMGLCGGLKVALRILVPIPVKIGLKIILRYRQRQIVQATVTTIRYNP
ncbi:unnamed protein product [Rotaria sp. Silwood2]|nr:unnamed protein product [Rotaria sp. Silwood2]CAF4272742.1 unnamed protein product [Rotaria sp. Silwood2]